ncbi:MAG: endolytic transglycosylase MltG [Alphaproteobacteria bacterium]|nr:endolytic transglycosylase MltG [Alphaproteobacteria bacterium]MBV9370579.1 endolytic transglycosylase MltG [Alphaproteobacteria bacterium]MBV9900053.1 endolytic transglycosylase MltG [Alphaproteobacteria bacterium]
MRKWLALGLLAAAALIAGLYLIQGWNGAGPAQRPTAVLIPRGASLPRSAEILARAGVIRSPGRFVFQAKLLGGGAPIKAGEYEIPAHASSARVLALLQSGRTLQRLVTVPEGMPSILVWERLMSAPALTGAVAVPAEGSVLPDSYAYQRGESRAAVLNRMQRAMARTLAALWAKRAPTTVVRSPAEAIVLASIVEKETGKASERAMVAGVYANRLRQGMKLDADPTVIYPVTKGKPLGRRILVSELHAVNGYNTYAMAGLPVGPIANPGTASIEAVLHPAQTPALYFVADGTGGHVFANSLAEHNANVEKWRAIRRARGEM